MNEFETSQREMNPLFSIWLHPKITTRYVLDKKSLFYVILFLSIGYIGSGFTGFIDWDIYPKYPIWLILLGTIILWPIFGIISNAFSALAIWLLGKLFKGKGTYKEIFKAVSLSVWPFIALIPVYLLWIIIDPDSLFYMSLDFNVFAIIGIIITAVVTIWSIVISIATVAEAHQISNLYSFFILLIFAFIMGIIFFIIGMILAFIVIMFGLAFYI